MTFEDFRKDLETKLSLITEFELQEYRFEPYNFGNGIIAYRIKGQNHKFEFDGRENELIWSVSKPHQKYFGANFKEVKRKDGLELSIDDLNDRIL